MDHLGAAFQLVLDPYVLIVIAVSGALGILIGAIPGLTVTMGVALLVPITFYMDPVPAIAAIVTMAAVAMYAGDIPGCLLRIPGTPASAAYTIDAYGLAQQGKPYSTLAIGVVASAIGGLIGSAVLVLSAPPLARLALRFSDYEYFWLTCLGLTCAAFVSTGPWVKGLASLFIGLLIATVGLDIVSGYPRFTFGSTHLMGGVPLIPAMVGMFAIAEIFRHTVRHAARIEQVAVRSTESLGDIARETFSKINRYRFNVLRGSGVGTLVGALPGAGADIAAWVSYAISRKFSRQPEKYGKGHVEGITDASAANSGALSAAWIPSLVFGIPGDTITAIAIGVLVLKGMQPGPAVFINSPTLLFAVFIVFFIANLLIVPLGLAAAGLAGNVLKVPQKLIMTVILGFCIVGAFAITNTVAGIAIMLVMGLIGYVMEENDIPVAPAILGLVLGALLEQNFMTAMLKAQGNLLAFFERPVAAGLGVATLTVWLLPLILWLWRRARARAAGAGAGRAAP